MRTVRLGCKIAVGLTMTAVVMVGGIGVFVAAADATKLPTKYHYMPVAGKQAVRITKRYFAQGCVGGMSVTPTDAREAHRGQGTLTGYYRGKHVTAVLHLSKGAKFCGAMAVTAGDAIPKSPDRGTEQFVPKFIRGKFIDPKPTGNRRSADNISVFIRPARSGANAQSARALGAARVPAQGGARQLATEHYDANCGVLSSEGTTVIPVVRTIQGKTELFRAAGYGAKFHLERIEHPAARVHEQFAEDRRVTVASSEGTIRTDTVDGTPVVDMTLSNGEHITRAVGQTAPTSSEDLKRRTEC